jgi:hypothetical protein
MVATDLVLSSAEHHKSGKFSAIRRRNRGISRIRHAAAHGLLNYNRPLGRWGFAAAPVTLNVLLERSIGPQVEMVGPLHRVDFPGSLLANQRGIAVWI